MDFKQTATQVLDLVGGVENVTFNATCMTRLRISLKDTSKVNQEAIKSIEGVLGIVFSDTIQIVFGPGIVNKVGIEFSNLTQIPLGSSLEQNDVKDIALKNKVKNKAKQTHPVQIFLKKIANIFVPLLPGIIAAGLINGLINVINFTTNGAYTSFWWYQTIATMGWALFAYLPILVGMNACKEFKGSAVLGAIAGAMSISNASMPLLRLSADGLSTLLPFTNAPFNPAAGGLLAALIGGIFFAYLERTFRKFIPSMLDTFFTPLLTLITGGLVAVLVLQPIGAFLTTGVYDVLNVVYSEGGILGGYVLSAGFLPLVSVGLHQALTPIHALLNDPNGATQGINYLLPILMMAGGGQVGAGFAIYFKTKSKKLKQLTRDSLPVGILGIGEPMMYAITLPLGKPFITACLGAGFGGVAATFFHLGAISQGVSGLFGLLIVQPGTWIQYIIAMLFAYVGGFIITWFFGIDDERINEIYGE